MSTEIPNTDGRTLRSERSRKKIVDAILELVDDGILVPTAQQVAERAKVGTRTVFRHFNEMDELHSHVNYHAREGYEQFFKGGPRGGELEERIHNLTEHFSTAFEKTTHLHMSTQAQFWRIESVRSTYRRDVAKLRRNLIRWLPELQEKPAAIVDAVAVTVSFESWYRLRIVQQLTIPAARAAMEATLTALLN